MTDTPVNIQHNLPIIQISLDQAGAPARRNLAILNRNRDLYIVQVRSQYKNFLKLGKISVLLSATYF